MAKILLVDDEDDARCMLAIGLERSGNTVIACANGADAYDHLTPDIDVVVTDLVMPKMDGIALLRAMAQRDHQAARIVITSFADKERVVEALNMGAHYLLEKPFSLSALEQVIAKVLSTASGPMNVELIFQRQLSALSINERERTLIIYVLKGMPNSQVASLLQISEQAVKSALYALYRKLGISSRGELFHLIFPI